MSRDIRERVKQDYEQGHLSPHLEIDYLFSLVSLDVPRFKNRPLLDHVDDVAETTRIAGEPDVMYRMACVLALGIEKLEEKRGPNPPTFTEKKELIRYKTRAIDCLQRALDAGWTEFFQTSIDGDLTSLRDDPRMKEFEAVHAYQQGVAAKKAKDDKKADASFEKCEALAKEWMKAQPGQLRKNDVELLRLRARARLGHIDEAVAGADAIRPKTFQRYATCLRLACVYALAAGATKDAKEQERYRGQAFESLTRAGKGITTEGRLMSEEDLESLRGDERFRKLFESLPK
jgi:hypothetical protein